MHRARRPAVLTVLAVGLAVVSVATAAKPGGFRDDFSSFDTAAWSASTRPFGHGAVDPANVSVANGSLNIALPADRLDGGEVRSSALYRFGTFRARLRAANAPSSLTAFFLYKAPDYQSEIDIEIYNDSTRRVMLSTYSGGAQTNTVTVLLPFDATADFHEYAIEWDTGSVRFLADGVPLQTWTRGVTKSAMYLYVNAWFPSWLAGTRPASDRVTSVDWVEYTSR
jgi:beta-glucanase (GH16 family)